MIHDYTESLLSEDQAKKALCGWVDFDTENYNAFLYIVANSGTFVHSISEINRLY